MEPETREYIPSYRRARVDPAACGGREPGSGGKGQRKALLALKLHEGMLLSCAPEQGEERGPWPQDLQPPPLPGHHKDEQEKSAGDERPATEPLFKVLDTPLSEGDEPTTLPAQRDLGHTVQMEGYLGRKHDLEGPNKKASNRCVGEGRATGEAKQLQGSPHQQCFDDSSV